MKAQFTGMGSFQGAPTNQSYIVISYLDRLEDGEGEASVAQYFGVFDPPSASWRDAHRPELPLLVPVTLSRTTRIEVTEVFRYANRPEVRTTFGGWAAATSLDGTQLDYTQLRPAPPGTGQEPLTMQAARQVLGFVPQLEQATGEFEAVLADIEQSQLIAWAGAASYAVSSATRNADDVVDTANIVWPDGSAGVYTGTNYSAAFGVFNGYTLTYVASGKKVTQPAVTRDIYGTITTQPALTVGAI